AVSMPIRDQRRPFRVDVELHCAYGAGALQDSGQGGDGLVVRGGVDDVAAPVDSDSGAPDADGVAECVPPLCAVVEGRAEAAVVDDHGEALPRPGDRLSWRWTPVPANDVDPTVLVGDERGEALLERLVYVSVQCVAVEAVAVDEAAVEGREQSPAFARRNLHRPAERRVGRRVSDGGGPGRGAQGGVPGGGQHELGA